MSGFFNIPSAPKIKKTPKGATGCEACGLCHHVKSPKIPLSGEGRKKGLWLGEAPGDNEDRLNTQFVGQAGDVIRKFVRIYGFDFEKDFWKTNALLCRPTNEKGNNRTPTKTEIKLCEPLWRSQLATIDPSFIFLLGQKAVESFFMYYSRPIKKNLSINRWRKLCIPDPITKAWVIPLYHPSFVVRNPDAETIFKLDLKWGLSQLNREKSEFPNYKERIIQLTNFDDLMGFLKSLKERKTPFSFDYETSGLKPYFPGHSIWSMAVSLLGEQLGYSWPYSYPNHWDNVHIEQIRCIWADIMSDSEIHKSGHNIQMEHPWTIHIIGTEPQGWIWDTMVRAHVEDERTEYTSLDFQTFINWGYEYGSNIAKFKKAVPNTHFNTIHKAPLSELLEYNGLDAFFQARLAEKQMNSSKRNDKETLSTNKAYELFHKGIFCFSDMQEVGIGVNKNHYEKQKIIQEKRKLFLKKRVIQSDELRLFKTKTGRDMDIGSSDDINKLLYQFLQLTPTKLTAKGNVSSDATVLESLDLPFAKDIVKIRQIEKNETTYIDGILNAEIDGRIHPDFNLNLVQTYRSSSSNPNFHNMPRRDKASMKMIRGGIIPSPGYQILEADYGAMEVRIIACYSKDLVLLKNLREGIDIHQEWANFLGCSRFDAKNAFVFALFYGSYWKSIHTSLLERGYTNISAERVRMAEQEFWKKYKGVKKWQEEMIRFYQTYGYIEMFTGFRSRGWLTRNKLANYPIQGTAFHCLLWAAIQVNKIRRQEGWLTKLIGQIHDSLITDTYPPELNHVLEVIKRVMTQDIMKAFPWIIVPLLSEIEVAEVDQPWHLKEEYDGYDEFEESA